MKASRRTPPPTDPPPSGGGPWQYRESQRLISASEAYLGGDSWDPAAAAAMAHLAVARSNCAIIALTVDAAIADEQQRPRLLDEWTRAVAGDAG
jgi:hypothetical protein